MKADSSNSRLSFETESDEAESDEGEISDSDHGSREAPFDPFIGLNPIEKKSLLTEIEEILTIRGLYENRLKQSSKKFKNTLLRRKPLPSQIAKIRKGIITKKRYYQWTLYNLIYRLRNYRSPLIKNLHILLKSYCLPATEKSSDHFSTEEAITLSWDCFEQTNTFFQQFSKTHERSHQLIPLWFQLADLLTSNNLMNKKERKVLAKNRSQLDIGDLEEEEEEEEKETKRKSKGKEKYEGTNRTKKKGKGKRKNKRSDNIKKKSKGKKKGKSRASKWKIDENKIGKEKTEGKGEKKTTRWKRIDTVGLTHEEQEALDRETRNLLLREAKAIASQSNYSDKKLFDDIAQLLLTSEHKPIPNMTNYIGPTYPGNHFNTTWRETKPEAIRELLAETTLPQLIIGNIREFVRERELLINVISEMRAMKTMFLLLHQKFQQIPTKKRKQKQKQEEKTKLFEKFHCKYVEYCETRERFIESLQKQYDTYILNDYTSILVGNTSGASTSSNTQESIQSIGSDIKTLQKTPGNDEAIQALIIKLQTKFKVLEATLNQFHDEITTRIDQQLYYHHLLDNLVTCLNQFEGDDHRVFYAFVMFQMQKLNALAKDWYTKIKAISNKFEEAKATCNQELGLNIGERTQDYSYDDEEEESSQTNSSSSYYHSR